MQLLRHARDLKQALKYVYQDQICCFESPCFVVRLRLDRCCLELKVRNEAAGDAGLALRQVRVAGGVLCRHS